MLLFLIATLSLTSAPQAAGPQRAPPPPSRPPARSRPPSTPAPARPRGDLYFANCTAARAAGYENINRGEPGYRPQLDRDNDGVACESR